MYVYIMCMHDVCTFPFPSVDVFHFCSPFVLYHVYCVCVSMCKYINVSS